jgi:hypothetical protein
MHPVIRLACFFLLVTGLAATSKTMFIVVVPLFLLLFKARCTFSSVFPLLKRLRWLFLSLLILYLWFNSPTLTWLPSLPSLLLALERIGALIIIVLSAHLLLTTTPTQDIIAALQWWFRPFSKIGFSTERLAVRLALVLDTVQTVQNLYTDTPPTATKNPITKISEKVARLFAQVFIYAERTPLRTLVIPELTKPPLWQWAYPLLLLLIVANG